MVSILVIGDSGTGKSDAIRDLNPETTVILSPNKKPLPFKGNKAKYVEGKNRFYVPDFIRLKDYLNRIEKSEKIKTVIVEDLTHLFNSRVMNDVVIKGYDKWTDLAKDFFDALIKIEINSSRDDLTLIVIAHVDRTNDVYGEREIGLKTPGKEILPVFA